MILEKKEYTREQSFCQPAVLPTNRIVPQLRSELFKKVDFCEYGRLVESLFGCSLDGAHQLFERNYKLRYLKNIINYLLKRY